MVPIVDYPPVVQRYLPHFRPHFANEPQFKHFAEYLTGLIVCWKFSVAFMNSQFVGHRDPSTKTRFLTEVDWPEDRVEETRIGLILKRVQGISPRKCRLAIDDVLIHHDRSKVMEGVSKHYDHCTGTYVTGHVLVNAHLITPVGHFPVAFDLYVPAQEDGESHQTKITMAQALIRRAKALGVLFETVVFDSWYLCEELAQFLDAEKLSWVSALKSNRIVLVNNRRVDITTFLNTEAGGTWRTTEVDGKSFTYLTAVIKLSTLGRVRIVALKDTEEQTGFKVLVTGEKSWGAEGIIRAYRARWSIETFHQDAKQNLGLESSMVRDLTGIKRHWLLVHLAYTILELASSLNGGLGKWVQDHAASIGAMCRQATQDTVRCLILWVIRVAQSGISTEILLSTLYGHPKLQVAESG